MLALCPFLEKKTHPLTENSMIFDIMGDGAFMAHDRNIIHTIMDFNTSRLNLEFALKKLNFRRQCSSFLKLQFYMSLFEIV